MMDLPGWRYDIFLMFWRIIASANCILLVQQVKKSYSGECVPVQGMLCVRLDFFFPILKVG